MVRPDSKSSDVGFDFPAPGSGHSVDANLPGIRMPLSNPVAVVILQVVVLLMIFKVSHLGVTGWVILPAAQLMQPPAPTKAPSWSCRWWRYF